MVEHIQLSEVLKKTYFYFLPLHNFLHLFGSKMVPTRVLMN